MEARGVPVLRNEQRAAAVARHARYGPPLEVAQRPDPWPLLGRAEVYETYVQFDEDEGYWEAWVFRSDWGGWAYGEVGWSITTGTFPTRPMAEAAVAAHLRSLIRADEGRVATEAARRDARRQP